MNRTMSVCLTVFILVFGCAKGYVSDDGEDTNHGVDGGINKKTDLDNCGAMGNVCTLRNEGACFEGYCRCNSNDDCHEPAVCLDGICQVQDVSGLTCWKDDDCEVNQYCIANHCSPHVCLAEVCDGRDNNCDGQIDEPEKTDIVCYTGPPSTLDVGACHAGARSCLMGMYTSCLREVVPHAEVGRFACDKQDSDCDGCIDGAGGGTVGCKKALMPHITFIFVLDTSSSMDSYIKAAKMLLKLFVKFRGDNRFDFALMDVAASNPPTYIKVIQSATDFDTFLTVLNTFKDGYNNNEPTYDAVYNIATGVYDTELNLKPDSMPVAIVIGDERAQTKMMPPMDEFKMCNAVDTRGVLLSVITQPKVFVDWDHCAADFTFPLSVDPDVMFKSLDGVLSLPCFEN